MGWLLIVVLLVAGLGVLAWMALGVMGRLVRGWAEAAALRATVAYGSARLRAGGNLVREWRRSRRGSNFDRPERVA